MGKNALEKTFWRFAHAYFRRMKWSDGRFGGVFSNEQRALEVMSQRGMRPVGHAHEPCLIVDAKALGKPVPKKHLLARVFVPKTPDRSPMHTHVTVVYRVKH
jgi:hypothetical protein